MFAKLIRISAFVSLCAACGGDDAAVDGDQPAVIDACQLVSQADAAALFGQPATRTTGAEVVDPALLGECLWEYVAADYSNQFLAIYVWDNDSDHYYDPLEGSEPYAIGDEGYIAIEEAGVDIGWSQQSLAVYLNYFTVGPSVPAGSSKVEEVKALAAEVESRL